jgi:hypothetical protein
LEQFRPSVRACYRRNLTLSRRPDFPQRVLAFLSARPVDVVRIHTAGDFYSAAYARKWLSIMLAAPAVRFFLYTRSWRVRGIRRVLVAMARLPNVRVWFSCDKESGVPRRVPSKVRLAWLMTDPDDWPPRADLVFRVRHLRGTVQKRITWREGNGAALVCPVENGATGPRTTCSQCRYCWRALPEQTGEKGRSVPLLSHGASPQQQGSASAQSGSVAQAPALQAGPKRRSDGVRQGS